MNAILRKLALSMIAAQLANPATKAQLESYVDAQVDGFVGSEADKLSGAANPFLKALGASLKTPELQTALNAAVNAEFEALIALVLAQLQTA